MDTNRIRFFVEICNTGSITRAAEKLHITQQGLSSSIHRLESDLGCDLFYRKNGGIILSETGKRILPDCQKILYYMDRVEEQCVATPAGKYPISLALTESIIVRLPSNLQLLLINGNDEFTVDFCEMYSRACYDKVEQGERTFGIVYGTPDERKLVATEIGRVKQVIIVNRQNPLAEKDSIRISELDNVPMVITRKGTIPHEALQQLFDKNNAHLNISYECDRPRQTIDIISNNPLLAARTLVDEVTEKDLQRVKVLQVENEDYSMPIYFIYKKGHELNTHERFFRHLVMDCCKHE